ncbi:hypothetical protein [Pseudomonas phage UF_RH7]|nr:hypothetical protein [Pseudomonas phage UF_RH7]
MAFDFSEALGKMRRVVHDTLSLPATYQDHTLADPVPLRIRWHTKLNLTGDLENNGYAQFIEGIESIIFDRTELALKNITIRERGKVTITAPNFSGQVIMIGPKDPLYGPIEEVYKVSLT